MKERIASNSRKWFGLAIAIVLYYLIHEVGHFIVAKIYGVFEKIRILGPGVQVVIKAGALTDMQNAVFCVSGAVCTLAAAYLLVFFSAKIAGSKNKIIKAICYYTTLTLLLADPLYLAIFYPFVGGGDMNGLLLTGLPENLLRLLFGAIAAIHILLILKKIYPIYRLDLRKQVFPFD